MKRNKIQYVVVIIALLTIFSGLRADSVGLDTSNYVTNLTNGYYKLYEIGFQKLSSLFESGNNIEIYLMVIGAVIYSFIIMRLWELRNTVSFPFAIFLFLIMHFSASMNTMRQYMACAIIFWGTRFLFSKKIVPYLLCILVAVSFHRTAIIGVGFLLIYFWHWNEMKRYQKIVSVSILTLLPAGIYYVYVVELSSYISEKMDYYFSNQGEGGIFIYVQILISISVYFLSKRYLTRMTYKEQKICNITLFFSLLGLMMLSIGYYVLFVGRIALYFELFTVVFYSMIWKATTARLNTGTVRPSGTMVFIQNAALPRVLILFVAVIPFVMQSINNSYKVLPYVMR